MGVFSNVANAEELDRGYYIYTTGTLDTDQTDSSLGSALYTPGQDENEFFETINMFSGGNTMTRVVHEMYLAHNDKTALFEADKEVTARLENVLVYAYINPDGTSYEYNPVFSKIYGSVIHTDGTRAGVTATITRGSDGLYDITLKFTTTKTVSQIYLQLMTTNLPTTCNGTSLYVEYGRGERTIDPNDMTTYGKFTYREKTAEVEAIEDLEETTQAGFEGVMGGISQLLNGITDLPGLIWDKMESGLMGLFVPDDEYLSEYIARWEELLQDRYGCVYEVVDLTFGSWEQISESDAQNTVEMPVVTIPLPDNCDFSFGGYDVKIVPDGFEWLAEMLKLMSGIACTILFVNGLRHRYDEVMGVEK